MVLMIASSACMVSANRGLETLKKENVHVHSTAIKNDQCHDEYEHIEDDNLQEYEQYVCDHIKPPKISAAMALLSEIGGRVLIEFIVLREALRRYYAALKVTLEKWFNSLVTQQ